MLPILPLILLLLFPHATSLRSVEGSWVSGRHEAWVLRQVIAVQQEEAVPLGSEIEFQDQPLRRVHAIFQDSRTTGSNRTSRVRDGPQAQPPHYRTTDCGKTAKLSIKYKRELLKKNL
ncbi:MAG: hypothetical protein C4320_00070 [Armatimonadota bacterium]